MTDDEGTTIPTRAVEKTIEIDAPIETVWKAITDAEEIKRWFGLDAGVEPEVGGKVMISWPNCTIEERVEIWDAPRHYATRMTIPDGMIPEGITPPRVATDYFLEARGGTTSLRVVQCGFGTGAEFDDEYDDITRGWGTFLANLEHYLERHAGTPCRQVITPVQVDLDAAAAWARLLGANGLARDGSFDGLGVGDRYEVIAASGDRLAGTIQIWDPPHCIGLSIDGLNDAALRVNFEHLGGALMCWAVVLTYGVAEAEVEALRGRLTEMYSGLFA